MIIPYEQQYEAVYNAIKQSNNFMRQRIEVEFVRADSSSLMPTPEENVTQHIALCDFAVADLSNVNPNVVYEVGYASAIGKPVILMSTRDAMLPSNLRGRHFLMYDPGNLESLTAQLPSFFLAAISAALEVPKKDSFVASGYTSIDSAHLPIVIREARNCIDILAPTLQGLVSTDISFEISHAIRRSPGLKLRILVLDPESSFVNFRAQALGRLAYDYRNELRHALASAMKIFTEIGQSCEVRLYDEMPYYHLYRVDENLFLSPLNPFGMSREGLTFRLKTNDPGAQSVLVAGFDYLWARSYSEVNRRY